VAPPEPAAGAAGLSLAAAAAGERVINGMPMGCSGAGARAPPNIPPMLAGGPAGGCGNAFWPNAPLPFPKASNVAPPDWGAAKGSP
jgi:hypothetical protein